MIAVFSLLLGSSLNEAIAKNYQAPSKGRQLLMAVRTGSLKDVADALEAGADANERDPRGSTALLEAAWAGNTDIAKLLLSHGADVNASHSETGATPLQYAVMTSNPAMVTLLLNAGSDVRRSYRNGQSALHLAAARKNQSIIEVLIQFHAPLEALDADENTPLNEAVLHDQLSSLQCLLRHGAAVNRIRPSDGRAPIHLACVKGYADLVPVLLEAGADPSLKDRSGQTPLDLALAYKSTAVVAELLKVGSDHPNSQTAAAQAMETATLKGQTELVQMLLQSGFDPNRRTSSDATYLHDAALKNRVKIAQLLIRAGAKLDALNHSGGTPLHDAALGGSLEAINLLLDQGAEIDARDRDERATPLMLAVSLGRTSAVELLLRRGANKNLTDAAGHTALDRARQNDDSAIIRVLQNPAYK